MRSEIKQASSRRVNRLTARAVTMGKRRRSSVTLITSVVFVPMVREFVPLVPIWHTPLTQSSGNADFSVPLVRHFFKNRSTLSVDNVKHEGYDNNGRKRG